MNSDDESISSNVNVSEGETKFIPQDDDEETLWEITEITAETKTKYKVQWAGIDPATNKPWQQSWVLKHDCTDVAVRAWKMKRKKFEKKAVKRASIGSNKSATSRVSILSKGSTSTAGTRPAMSNATSKSDTHVRNKKRSRKSATNDGDGDVVTITARPIKRRKLEVEDDTPRVVTPPQDSYEVKPTKFGKAFPSPEEGEEENGETRNVAPKRNRLPARLKGRFSKCEVSTESGSVRRKVLVSKVSKGRDPASTNGRVQFISSDVEGDADDTPPPPVGLISRRHDLSDAVEPQTPQIDLDFSKGSSPDLSPAAKERLQKFDSDMREVNGWVTLFDVPSNPQSPKLVPPSLPSSPLPPFVPSPVPVLASSDELPILSQTEEDLVNYGNAPSLQTPDSARVPSLEPPSGVGPGSPDVAQLKQKSLGNVRNLDDSYRLEVVPETEPESSNNTQSQSQSQPQQSPVQPKQLQALTRERVAEESIDVHRTNAVTQPSILGTPLRANGSLTSKMRPKTPGSVRKSVSQFASDAQSPSPLPLQQSSARLQQSLFGKTSTLEDIAAVVVDNHGKGSVAQPSTFGTPLRAAGSIISRMRPKTRGSVRQVRDYDIEFAFQSPPGFEASVHDDGERDEKQKSKKVTGNGWTALKHLPLLSPSQFTPHLPPSSISEGLEESVGVDELVSSIEQFSPLQRERSKRKLEKKKDKKRVANGDFTEGDEGGDTEDLLSEQDDVLRKRGMELAEETRKRKKSEESQARRGLRLNKVLLADISKKDVKRKGKETGLTMLEVGVQRRGGSEERGADPEESQTVDADDDLNSLIAEGAKKALLVLALRQEEEESTQDDLVDQQISMEDLEGVAVDVEMGGVMEVPEPEDQDVGEMVTEKEEEVDPKLSHPLSSSFESNSQKQAQVQENHSPAFTQDPQATSSSIPPSPHPIPELSLPQSKKMSDDLIKSPIAPKAHMLDTDEASRGNILPDDSEPLDDAGGAIDPNLEETANLLAGRTRSETRPDEIAELEQVPENSNTVSGAPQTDLAVELAEVREQFAQETAAWERERAALTASITNLSQRNERAEKDVDFFRQQYTQASTFVTSVRKENNELEKRAQIAEEQARNGVVAVKMAFQQRIQALEDDVRSWKRLALFIMEKDQRTNDEIRQRAADEPQLRRRVGQLEATNTRLRAEIAWLEDELEGRAGVRFPENGRPVGPAEEEFKVEDEPVDEMVFLCKWRTENDSVPCGRVFTTVQELKAHMYNSGHLEQQMYPD